jgi:hypothetical protein
MTVDRECGASATPGSPIERPQSVSSPRARRVLKLPQYAHTLTRQDRIAELEDALKEKERRLQELKADLDKANDLFQRQDEHFRACAETIEVWKTAFEMKLRADGVRVWNEAAVAGDMWHDRYVDLVRKWNRNVADFNAAMVRRRDVGRPLAASHAQRQTVSSSCAPPANRCARSPSKPALA